MLWDIVHEAVSTGATNTIDLDYSEYHKNAWLLFGNFFFTSFRQLFAGFRCICQVKMQGLWEVALSFAGKPMIALDNSAPHSSRRKKLLNYLLVLKSVTVWNNVFEIPTGDEEEKDNEVHKKINNDLQLKGKIPHTL